MKALLFVFSLAIVRCTSIPWKPLNTFQETFWEAKLSAENVIGSVVEILQNRTEDSLKFIKSMDDSKLAMPRSNSNTENYECSSKLENLKKDFKDVYNRLELPLMEQIAHIRQRLSEIASAVVYYRSIADSKYWSCKLSKTENCTDYVEKWLDTKIILLSCEMDSCESHVIKKRQFDWFQFGYNNGNPCPESYFQCPNSSCVPNFKVCDGNYDCGDKSDEYNCPHQVQYSPNNCSSKLGTYLCGNKDCISLSKVCDGNDDCGDKSDEYNCPNTLQYNSNNCSLEFGTYLCGNRKCVDLSSVCDGNDDCGDGTDEGGNCTSGCREDCHPTGVCFNTPKSKDCITSCPRGLFETTSGCRRNIEPDRSPVSNLLFDLERSISRHSAAYSLLKSRTIFELFILSYKTECRNHKFSKLDKITKIQAKSFNKKSENNKTSRV